MATELKATVINMKTLSQDITDPVVVGAGEAAGRALRVIFTQEAAARFTPNTKVYLSWYHQEKDIRGYNVFTEIKDEEDEDFPPTWEIKYPKSMLYEGNVLACIQIVDEISISTSVNFIIHVLIDPNDGSTFEATDDFTEFQNAVISLATVEDQAEQQMQEQKTEFENMQLLFEEVVTTAEEAKSIAEEAKQISENASETATEALETTEGFTALVEEIQEKEQKNTNDIADVKETADRALDKANTVENSISSVEESITEVTDNIANINSGLTEEEVIELIRQELDAYIAEGRIS